MNRLLKYFLILAIVPALVFTGCKKDEEEVTKGDFTTLKTYLVSNQMDLTGEQLLKSWVVDAKLIADGGIVDPTDNSIPGYHVLDIRAAADFAAGHIKGAVNTTLKDILTAAKDLKDKPILVVCYTGQTAGHAVMALRLKGYTNAAVLKWGMACWNADFAGPWTNAISSTAVGNANWVTTAAPALTSNTYPDWTSTTTDAATLLGERVQTMLDGGLKGVNSADVLANPANYNIINYWPEADYLTFGHFAGAYNVPVISLAGDLVKAIDPKKETLIYCYTGQTSSMAVAWLNILGYNAKSVKFGVNSLNYDALKAASKPVYKSAFGYTYVTGK